MMNILKKNFSNSWFFPRYIGIAYMEPALKQTCVYAKGTMLDVGCGMRRYEPLFSANVDRYIGLDWPQFDDRAKQNVIGDALKIPIRSSSIDTVLATELMEHLLFPNMFLEEAARILCNEGVLILSVPFMEPLHEEPRDYYRFTPYSLKLLLEEHGFEIRQISHKGGWWSVVLGSFISQALYEWANPLDKFGHRHYRFWSVFVLPICALAQWLAYQLDRIFVSHKYSLGFVVVATRI